MKKLIYISEDMLLSTSNTDAYQLRELIYK